MKVIILSGVSGSGKSTWAKDKGVIFSADSFFMRNGVYRFDPGMLQQAHEACLHDFVQEVCAVEDGFTSQNTPIIVDNTNTTVDEIAPYYAVAKAYGFDVDLITFNIPWETAFLRNAHRVPERSVKSQFDRLRSRQLPPHWKLVKSVLTWTNGGWVK